MPLSRVPQKEARVILLPLAKAILLSAALLGGCRDTEPTGPVPPSVQAPTANVTIGKVLLPLKDTYVMRRMPDKNHGAEDSLRVQKADSNRTLIMFDQQALLDSIGGDSIISAKLEMTVMVNGGNWGTGGRYIWIYRMNQAWTEGGATWDCANDSIPSNSVPNCTGQSWSMIGPTFPFAATKTAQALVTNTTTGVVWWNVTNDVRMYQAGTKTNNGWLLKLEDETLPGKIAFYAREGSVTPHLVLSLWHEPPLPTNPNTTIVPDDSLVTIVSPTDTEMVYFRTMAQLQFKPGTTGSQFTALLQKYGAQLVGGVRFSGTYIIRYGDPGSTWSAFLARIDALAAEPIVLRAMPMTRYEGKPIVYSRFPVDGQNLQRVNWFGSSDTVWAMNAIRAPMAWGCEQGMYGGVRARVGVFEWDFDSTHPDLALSRTGPMRTFPSGQGVPLSQLEQATFSFHGTATSGLVSAQGDNAQGISGTIWESDLRLYQLGLNNAKVPFTAGGAFEQALEAAVQDSIKILSLSIGLRVATDTTGAAVEARLVQSLQQFMDSNPRALVVIAVGNGANTSTSAAQLTALRGPSALHAALMKLKLQSSSFGDRIIFVAGTQRGGQFYSSGGNGSNFFAGGTEIAAPADKVAILGSRTAGYPFSGDLVLDHGTSLSAPMVAGVAAQLLTMDPTLTPAQLKDYLLRGAQQPRINPTTGASVPAATVTNTPGGATLYQLDAYGSLSLLSKERAGTPICGNPLTFDPGPTSPKIVVTRSGNNSQTIGFPTDNLVYELSVAPGGRKFASRTTRLSAFGDTLRIFTLQANGFAQVATEPNIYSRQYLERDSVTQKMEGAYLISYLFGPGKPASGIRLNPDSMVLPAGVAGGSSAGDSFSPDGSAVLVGFNYQPANANCTYLQDLFYLPLGGGSPQSLVTATCAGPNPIPVDWAWDQNSSRVVASYYTSASSAEFRAWRIAGSVASPDGQTVAVANRQVIAAGVYHTTDASGALVNWAEWDAPASTCHRTSRLARGTFATVTDSVVTGDACFAMPVLGNLRGFARSPANR